MLSHALAFGRVAHFFEKTGHTIEEISNFDEVKELVEGIDKPYLSSFSSPDFNDFTQTNALWLVVRKNGLPAYIGCARLENIGNEGFGNYLKRVVKRHHGSDVNLIGIRQEVERQISGKLVYFGDLFASKAVRGSRVNLSAFLALAHLAVSLKWDPDWTYCFIREPHILRGSAALYGFTNTFSDPLIWEADPPFPRTPDDWLVALPRRELLPTATSILRRIEGRAHSDDNEREK
ncbi:hypothetical protein [Ascidiaceihabitans sp.]|uniref:hypothetical protein n=1 Tax=Ascidiaceihabitans sp. TaxID=1872644 RepID=UPI003299E2E1